MKAKYFIILLLLSLVSQSISYSASIKGRILDLQEKPFKNAAIITICNSPDGSQDVQRFNVDNKGNYNINIKFTGYMQLIFGIDTIDKLALSFFVNDNTKYKLDMKMPHVYHPYVPFDSIRFSSTNKGLIDKIKLYDSVFNSTYMLSSYLSGYVNKPTDTNGYIKKIIMELTNFNEYFAHNTDIQSRYIISSQYINSIECIRTIGNSKLLNEQIINYFISNFNYSTSYLSSIPINYDNIAALLPNEYENEYLINLAEKHSSDFVRAEVLGQATAYYYDVKNDRETSAKFYNKLYQSFPTSKTLFYAAMKYDPKKQIQVGNPLPAFDIESMEEDTMFFNKEYFKGKYLLLHFWHTASKENNSSNNYITVAKEEFFDSDIEFLSISMDGSKRDVINYRLKALPMKWLHSVDTNGVNSKLALTFELYKIPYLILVSPDGIILELDDNLRGDRLVPTLRKYLK